MPLLLYNRAILEKICMNRKTVADLDLSGPLHRREFDYIFDGRGASQPERGEIRAACERKSSCHQRRKSGSHRENFRNFRE